VGIEAPIIQLVAQCCIIELSQLLMLMMIMTIITMMMLIGTINKGV
jgi:hypothetical protein